MTGVVDPSLTFRGFAIIIELIPEVGKHISFAQDFAVACPSSAQSRMR